MAHHGFNKVSTYIRSNQDIELKKKTKTTLIHTDQSKHTRSDMVPHLTHQNTHHLTKHNKSLEMNHKHTN